MEVIRRGPTPEWPREVKCVRCRAVLLVQLEDIHYGRWITSGYEFDDTAEYINLYTFRCPECDLEANGNFIPADQIPFYRRDELE